MEYARIHVWRYASADQAWHVAQETLHTALAEGWTDAYIIPIRNRNGLTVSYRIVSLEYEPYAYGIIGENGVATMYKGAN